MSRLGRCWYLPDLQRTKLPFLPLFISPAFPECPLVLWGGFCGRPHKVGYCRLLLTSVVPPSAPLLWWPIKLQGSDQNVSIDLSVKPSSRRVDKNQIWNFPKSIPSLVMKTQKNDKKCNLTTFDAKATQSHTEFMYSNICMYPPVMGFCAAGKKVGEG